MISSNALSTNRLSRKYRVSYTMYDTTLKTKSQPKKDLPTAGQKFIGLKMQISAEDLLCY
jgi:hypothetical protein